MTNEIITIDKASFYIDGYLLPFEQVQDFTIHILPDAKTHGTILLIMCEDNSLYYKTDPFSLLVEFKKSDNTEKELFNGTVKKVETNLYIETDDGFLSLRIDFEEI